MTDRYARLRFVANFDFGNPEQVPVNTVDLRALLEERDELLEALRALEVMGMCFFPGSVGDDSPFAQTPDETVLQIGASKVQGWSITVGDLRRIARAIARAEGGEKAG